MSSRSRNVDLGPLYLEVGEGGAASGTSRPAGAVDNRDISRFESLMHKGHGQGRHRHLEEAMAVGPLQGMHHIPFADTEEIGAEIAHIWAGTGLHSAREVRVVLREAILPETAVRLCESNGRLRIEFTCGSNRVSDWLGRKLPGLASDLGARLDRELELVIFTKDSSITAECNWLKDSQ
ncbi:type III secretion HpaP family protein [Caenimonas sp. SL110]|uniref:type III secretion HpaP family protein n=1 Tax=Caenimonas sp. SL110 TaxID=1450524 RepID=UPI000653C764|nr:type III secretion HpaP family protein [Caenimonas sp. SL110]